MPLALITGGSAGLGAAFADRLAARGHDLLLVARGEERLRVTAREITARHGVRVDVLVADLSRRHGLFRLEALLGIDARCADAPLGAPEGLPVDVLVNNAGYECGTAFPDADRADVQAEIDLNISVPMRLTHAVLPGMLGRRSGTVINVGSVAGWLPAAGSTYGPTKAWVAAFTDSLAPVVAGTGVRVLALCPGPVRTGWNGQTQPSGPLAALLWTGPARVVDTCLADLDRGRSLSVPGVVHRPLVDLLEMPRRSLRVVARVAGTSRTARYAAGRVPSGGSVPDPSGGSGALPVAEPAPAPVPARRPAPVTAPARPTRAPGPSIARAQRPGLPDVPARPGPAVRPAPRVGPCVHRSAHFVPTARLTGEARVRADRARRS